MGTLARLWTLHLWCTLWTLSLINFGRTISSYSGSAATGIGTQLCHSSLHDSRCISGTASSSTYRFPISSSATSSWGMSMPTSAFKPMTGGLGTSASGISRRIAFASNGGSVRAASNTISAMADSSIYSFPNVTSASSMILSWGTRMSTSAVGSSTGNVWTSASGVFKSNATFSNKGHVGTTTHAIVGSAGSWSGRSGVFSINTNSSNEGFTGTISNTISGSVSIRSSGSAVFRGNIGPSNRGSIATSSNAIPGSASKRSGDSVPSRNVSASPFGSISPTWTLPLGSITNAVSNAPNSNRMGTAIPSMSTLTQLASSASHQSMGITRPSGYTIVSAASSNFNTQNITAQNFSTMWTAGVVITNSQSSTINEIVLFNIVSGMTVTSPIGTYQDEVTETVTRLPEGAMIETLTKTKCAKAGEMVKTHSAGSTVTTEVPKLCIGGFAVLVFGLKPGSLCHKVFSFPFNWVWKILCPGDTGPPGPPGVDLDPKYPVILEGTPPPDPVDPEAKIPPDDPKPSKPNRAPTSMVHESSGVHSSVPSTMSSSKSSTISSMASSKNSSTPSTTSFSRSSSISSMSSLSNSSMPRLCPTLPLNLDADENSLSLPSVLSYITMSLHSTRKSASSSSSSIKSNTTRSSPSSISSASNSSRICPTLPSNLDADEVPFDAAPSMLLSITMSGIFSETRSRSAAPAGPMCLHDHVRQDPPNCVEPASTVPFTFKCSAGSNIGAASYDPATWCGCNSGGEHVYPTMTSGKGDAACAYTTLPTVTVKPTAVPPNTSLINAQLASASAAARASQSRADASWSSAAAKPSAECAILADDDYGDSKFRVTGINGWAGPNGESLEQQESGCGVLDWWWYPNQQSNFLGRTRTTETAVFWLGFFKGGCIERAIHSAGGPSPDGGDYQVKCTHQQNLTKRKRKEEIIGSVGNETAKAREEVVKVVTLRGRKRQGGT